VQAKLPATEGRARRSVPQSWRRRATVDDRLADGARGPGRAPNGPTWSPSISKVPLGLDRATLHAPLRFAALTGLAWLPLLLWFAAFKPGIMSADSLGSWSQATTGNIRDDITPSYTALMKISILLTDSPSALAIGQQLLLASSFVALGLSLVRLGVRRWLVVATTGVTALSPTVGAFSVSLWKDVPYSAALIYCGAAIVGIVAAHQNGARSVREHRATLLLLLGATCAAVLIRQNGVFLAAFLGLGLTLCLPGIRRWVAGGTVFAVLTLALLKLVVYPLAGVDPSPQELKYASLLHDVGAVVHHHPEELSTAQRSELEELAPLDQWSRNYSCYTVNPLYYGGNLNFSSLAADPGGFRSVWLAMLQQDPGTLIGHRICAASVAWRPQAVDRRIAVTYTVSSGIDPNDAGLVTTPLSDTLHRWGVDLIDQVNKPEREWFLWRAPTWIYACYVGLVVAALRTKRRMLLLPGVVLLAQQLAVSVINPAQDARYMMGALILAVLLLPVATIAPASGVRRKAAERPPAPRAGDATIEDPEPNTTHSSARWQSDAGDAIP
jgi:hypothetical protein